MSRFMLVTFICLQLRSLDMKEIAWFTEHIPWYSMTQTKPLTRATDQSYFIKIHWLLR